MKTKSNSRSAFFKPRVVIGFALCTAGLVLAFASMSSVVAGDNAAAELRQSVPAQASGTWTVTGNLVTARYGHTSTLLPNGQVLVAGGIGVGVGDIACQGQNCVALASAELYDPATGMWTATGSMAFKRFGHTATLLPNGQVLVAGGYNSTNGYLARAELYDPATGVWTATGSMALKRQNHTATLLPNGQVLVSGGFNSATGDLASAELYDPATGVWTATGSMANARELHTATLLQNGQVLVVGGLQQGIPAFGAELYDPATGVWTRTSNMGSGRQIPAASLLLNGQVLVSGGYSGRFFILAQSQLYNP